jgi:branched-chain amino acid transport system ATP-binding protein
MPPASPPSAPLLEARSLDTYYGQRQALYGLSLKIAKGETIGLMGRNGMGKTTLVRTLVGLLRPRRGQVLLDGEDITALPTYAIAQRGVAYVPEGRGIFANLSVAENLSIAEAGSTPGDWTLPRVLELFPRLAQRLTHHGDQLSGGEQQMLAIGRILRTGARLLLLDEPTEGLAPVIIQQIGKTIRALKEQGFTILLVEQNFRFASTVADRYYVMEHGRIIDQFANAELDANVDKLHDYLGV